MAIQEAWYVGQRAESLAVMYLTRRNDLIVSKQQEDYDLDFLVTILKDGNYSGRLFGIEVKAKASTPDLIQRNGAVEIKLNGASSSLTEFPFPVCLFFFTLENDCGYYQWILEPDIEGQNNSKLLLNKSNKFKKLTNEEMSNIVSAVNNDSRNESSC